MTVISIVNKKGGVGKTTFVANIGHELSRHSKVLLLDMDAQCDLTRALKLGSSESASNYKGKPTILDVLLGKEKLTKAEI